jgi:hypothetical protein
MQTSIGGVFKVSNFVFQDMQVKVVHCPKNKRTLGYAYNQQ